MACRDGGEQEGELSVPMQKSSFSLVYEHHMEALVKKIGHKQKKN